jgi:NAD+ kinase
VKVGFVVHRHRDAALILAKETAEWLVGLGHDVEIYETEATPDEYTRPRGLDLAVSLGGDGTMLRTVDLVCGDEVPVLGVNFGRLGYLTVVEPAGLREALQRFLHGDYQVEARMTLDVAVTPAEGSREVGATARISRSALNDVVLQRTLVGHTMHTDLAVNGLPFLTFASDSLILATPTGSTAYNLSARGPIVSPRARVQVVTPVAPHMLFDRSLVLDADETVTITAIGEQPIDVVIDGWHATTMGPGDTVECREGAHDAMLVTFGERDFHRILKTKFNLADR